MQINAAERDILRLCEPVPPLRETVNQGNESTLTCITHKLFSHTFRHVFNGNTSIFIRIFCFHACGRLFKTIRILIMMPSLHI